MKEKRLSRRQLLRVTGLAAGTLALAACAPQAAAPAAAPAESKPADAKPADAKPAEPAAPAAASGPFMGFEANNVDQWGRIPADHKVGTLVSQDDWYKVLGEPPKELSIAGFKGGWGELWIDAVVESLKKDFPNMAVTKDFDPRIWEKMKPRLVAGEIPDWNYAVIGPWGGDWKKGVDEKLVVPLDYFLDIEPYGYKGKSVGSLMIPGTLQAANGDLPGGQWTMPMTLSAYGFYLNATMFEKNGWPDPSTLTWEAFMDLCKKINDSGTPPFTYAGKYPGYWQFPVLDALVYYKGGNKAICDGDNLVEGAWTSPERIWAIEQIQTIFKNGWIFKGSEAMTHTESQQIFVDGKCAMIPNGSWMPNEQKETTPKDFKMKFFKCPAPSDSKGDAKAILLDQGSSELQVGNGKNPLWGMEVMRRIYSPLVQSIFAEKIGTPMAISNMVEGVKTTPEWDSVIAAIKSAGDARVITSRAGTWYPEMGKKLGESWGDVWFSKISAKDAWDFLERGAKEVRANPDIKKQTRECK